MHTNEVRLAAERQLRSKLGDDEWQFLVSRFYVEDAETEKDNALQAIVDAIRDLRKRGPARKPPARTEPRSKPKPKDETSMRQKSISTYLWLNARHEPEVIRFRRQVLQGRLYSTDEEEALVAALDAARERIEAKLADQDRPMAADLYAGTVVGRVLQEIRMEVDGELYPEHGRLAGVATTVVGSIVEDEDGVAQVIIDTNAWRGPTNDKPDGLSEWVADIIRNLSLRYGWSEEQAFSFLVSDMRPAVSAVTVSRRVQQDHPVASRLLLSIDPATSPEEVRAIYSAARTALVGKHFRTLSDKHTLLAFSTIRVNQDSPKWDELMGDWNRLNADDPEWRYEHLSNFRRDAANARKALFMPKYDDTPVAESAEMLVVP